MSQQPEYLNLCRDDWDPYLSKIRYVLEEAENHVVAKTDPEQDSVFSCPNRAIMVGTQRYWEVNAQLKRACDIGLFGTITAVWEPLTDRPGGFHELVLRGEHTTLSAIHLAEPQDTPRDSVRRNSNRQCNYQMSLFDDPDEIELSNSAVHLTLVHGGKEEKFAFLRLYYDPEYPNRFVPVTGNMMQLPIVVAPADVEEVKEPQVGIKPHLLSKKEDAEG